jgi:hypothetical protein
MSINALDVDHIFIGLCRHADQSWQTDGNVFRGYFTDTGTTRIAL